MTKINYKKTTALRTEIEYQRKSGMSYGEIATLLGISKDKVKYYVSHPLKPHSWRQKYL